MEEVNKLDQASGQVNTQGNAGQPGLFSPKPGVHSIAKLKNLLAINIEEIQGDMNILLESNQTLVQHNSELIKYSDDLKVKYNKLLNDYNATLDAIENKQPEHETFTSLMGVENDVAKLVVLFDPAIHTHKPSRPITNAIRLQILDAYENVYKKDENVKTLPEFFAYVNLNISATASRTEIEGVIYNRFDERLYLA